MARPGALHEQPRRGETLPGSLGGGVDYGPSAKFEVHHTTMPENLYHIENATRLTELPASGFRVIVAPINLAGGSGGPTRLFALLDK